MEFLQAVTNFALYSAGATAVSLCLFKEADLQTGKVTYEIDLHKVYNKSGDVWHIALPQLDASLLYGMTLLSYAQWRSNCDIRSVLLFAHAGFRVKGDHEEEVVVDHCTMDTFDSMQSAEDTVTIVNPGQRYNNVYLSDSGTCVFVLPQKPL